MKPADPIALFHARRKVEAELGRLLNPKISAVLALHLAPVDTSPESTELDMRKTAGGRALLNRLLSLAVANGTDTPWQILRVSSASAMTATLAPLNKQRKPASLAGQAIEFMELN